MPDTLNAAELRRLAMQCGTRALERDCQAADRNWAYNPRCKMARP
jgi:hypothetical protein